MTQLAHLNESTTVLIIRDSDPLCVETSILTADSSVFTYILEECQFEEHDLTDFSSEAVGVFLTLLRDKELIDVDESMFREIHKLAVAFKIVWLEIHCNRWIERKISAVSSEEDRAYVFEESYYVLKRLEKDEYMNMFVDEFGGSDSITFISRYLEDFDNLDTEMLYPLLKLAGSNHEVILDTLTQSVANNPGLSKNAFLVLQNINMCCFQADWQRWSDLFDEITELPEISTSDMRITSKLQNMAWRKSRSNEVENKEKVVSQTVVFDSNKRNSLVNDCVTLAHIVTAVSTGKTDSMRDIALVICKALKKYKYGQEIDQFIPNLERLCEEKQIQRLPWHLIDLMINVSKHSTKNNAEDFISLLTSIRQSKVLSSSHRENIVIERYTKIKVNCSDDLYRAEEKWIYRFKHPALTGRCTQPGECGFIFKYLRLSTDKDASIKKSKFTLELITDTEYYVDTGVHCHDHVISARDMCVYNANALTLPDGTKLDTVGGWQWWWERLLPAGTKHMFKGNYVAYNVSDFMVAKSK